MPHRVLFICHDGDLYGSQRSLCLMVANLPPSEYQCLVSLARTGPLAQLLTQYPHVRVITHKRLQWVKHDPRNLWQRVGDCLSLALAVIPRTWYLINTIRREKINLVHTNVTVSLEGALAAAVTRLPHVWHIRELFMEKSPKFHMVLGRRFSRWIIDRFSDQVICISQAVREQFAPYLAQDPDKYPLIYNALPLEQLPPLLRWNDPQRVILKALALATLSLPEGPGFRVGYIGRLSEGKGFHELLEAFILLKARHLPVELLVAGSFVDAAYQRRILNRVTECGWQESIHFLGQQQDLTPLYEAIDLLVVPSANEPFGRVVIEAMAQGVPCVGANAGGIPEIITDHETGWLYPPGQVEALAELMADLSGSLWKLETIRQNARRMVCERFNIETQIRMLRACYQSAMMRHQF